MAASEIKTFPLGDFALQSGATLPGAFIAYKTFGDASASLPAIVYPTWFSGAIADNEWLIGDDMALSPRRYFIVVPALFGNGESTSPSNSGSSIMEGVPRRPFPDVTFYDNVKAQHRLLTEGLGIKGVKAVLGWSMGTCACVRIHVCLCVCVCVCLWHSSLCYFPLAYIPRHLLFLGYLSRTD